MFFSRKFPLYRQVDRADCGLVCLQMVSKFYGKHISLASLRQKTFYTRDGISLADLVGVAKNIGLKTFAASLSYEQLTIAPLPCIAHWNNDHFIVIYKIDNGKIFVADPKLGYRSLSREDFLSGWASREGEGVTLFLEPEPHFFSQEESLHWPVGVDFFSKHLLSYRKRLFSIIGIMFLGVLFQLALPFLTKAAVDIGIQSKDVNVIYLVFIGEIILYLGKVGANFISSKTLLEMGARINISVISEFLEKITKLPLNFFDASTSGDLLQKISDHYRIEVFFTSIIPSIAIFTVQILAFSGALFLQSSAFFSIFVLGSFLSGCWALLFMNKRRELDYKKFEQATENQNILIELFSGMVEIKINGAEKRKRSEWQKNQEALIKTNISSLIFNQYQTGGEQLINQIKNTVISFLAAISVIRGDLTLGSMVAIQMIVGQLSYPVSQILSLLQPSQDAKISMERLLDIHKRENENTSSLNTSNESHPIQFEQQDILIEQLYFKYGGKGYPDVFRNLSLTIPAGRITAIVGASGSGKTTLLKLLLKFYQPNEGKILLGPYDLSNINDMVWRKHCGVVMQDGYIFSDSVARNIALYEEKIDFNKIADAIDIANATYTVESLPQGINTKIGQGGMALSRGQIQRILIARAIYKSPMFFFLDEATNSLDASSENTVMKNLHKYFVGRTVIVIAHRLSTVKDAHKIVVLDQGKILEVGDHEKLLAAKGSYHSLVKDQLLIE